MIVEHFEKGQDIDVVDPNGNTRTVKLEPDKGFDHKPGSSTKAQREAVVKNLGPDFEKAVKKESGMS